jgi:DNA-binding response OmpR family regulator
VGGLTSSSGTSAARLRALVIEDEAGIRELLRLHLGLGGFALEEVADGRLALERVRPGGACRHWCRRRGAGDRLRQRHTDEELRERICDEHTSMTLRTVDTLVTRVCRKFEVDAENPAVIITVWDEGYKAAP